MHHVVEKGVEIDIKKAHATKLARRTVVATAPIRRRSLPLRTSKADCPQSASLRRDTRGIALGRSMDFRVRVS